MEADDELHGGGYAGVRDLTRTNLSSIWEFFFLEICFFLCYGSKTKGFNYFGFSAI